VNPNVRELVYWILAETAGWSRAEIDEVIRSGDRKDAKVALPLYWVYISTTGTGSAARSTPSRGRGLLYPPSREAAGRVDRDA
jgi:hypothetical protein